MQQLSHYSSSHRAPPLRLRSNVRSIRVAVAECGRGERLSECAGRRRARMSIAKRIEPCRLILLTLCRVHSHSECRRRSCFARWRPPPRRRPTVTCVEFATCTHRIMAFDFAVCSVDGRLVGCSCIIVVNVIIGIGIGVVECVTSLDRRDAESPSDRIRFRTDVARLDDEGMLLKVCYFSVFVFRRVSLFCPSSSRTKTSQHLRRVFGSFLLRAMAFIDICSIRSYFGIDVPAGQVGFRFVH